MYNLYFIHYLCFMEHVNAKLALRVLTRDYPHVAKEIEQKITSSASFRLTDLTQVPFIIKEFCKVKEIKSANWIKGNGKNETSKNRQLLVAVLLKFYHPEKLYCLDDGYTFNGLIKKVSKELGINYQTTLKTFSKSVDEYNHFNGKFKAKVDSIFNSITSYYGKEEEQVP